MLILFFSWIYAFSLDDKEIMWFLRLFWLKLQFNVKNYLLSEYSIRSSHQVYFCLHEYWDWVHSKSLWQHDMTKMPFVWLLIWSRILLVRKSEQYVYILLYQTIGENHSFWITLLCCWWYRSSVLWIKSDRRVLTATENCPFHWIECHWIFHTPKNEL